jgi:hypothetical protein
VLAWKFPCNASRRFLYEDLVRSSRRTFFGNLVKFSYRSWYEVLVGRHSIALVAKLLLFR